MNVAYGCQRSKWLPRLLELLFAGQKELEVDEQLRKTHQCQAYTEETRLMELLTDEEADKKKDSRRWGIGGLKPQVMTLMWTTVGYFCRKP